MSRNGKIHWTLPTFLRSSCNLKRTLKCNGCGGTHSRAKCILRDTVCHKCSHKGHIAKVCRSSSNQSMVKINIMTNALSTIGKRRWHYVTTSWVGKTVTLQYNTGLNITVIGKSACISSLKFFISDTVEHASWSKLDIVGRFSCSAVNSKFTLTPYRKTEFKPFQFKRYWS